jgi:predicted dehydrogenase
MSEATVNVAPPNTAHMPEAPQAPQAPAAPAARRPRLGFLGVGWIGRHRMSAIAETDAADIVALCDPSRDAAHDALRAVPAHAACVHDSLDALLAAGVDGVVIATPSALHADQAVAALERGVAVFCQKPLGRSAAETKRVVDAARANDRLLGVDLSYRFTRAVQQIRELIGADDLGDIYAVDLVFHNAYGPDKPWFYDRTLSGGGCVIDLGIHLVDLALWMLDHPRVIGGSSRLYSKGRALARADDAVEDYAVARLDLDSGTSVQLTCSWNLPAGCDAVIGAAFYGTRGGAALRNVDGSFFDFVAERFRGTQRETLSGPPDEWGGRAAVDWVRRLAAGERFDAGTERLIDVAAALDRIYDQ